MGVPEEVKEQERDEISQGHAKQSMAEWKEEGAREGPGEEGTRQGPRPGPRRQPVRCSMVELQEEGAMVETWEKRQGDAIYFDGTGNGGDPDGAEETLQLWRVKVELTVHGTEAEAGIRETAVEPVRQMTTVELEGRRSLV